MSNEKSKGNVLKVVELGLQDKIFNAMKQPGFSVLNLTKQFNTEGIEITAQSIRKFIKKSKKAQQEIIQQDLKAANELIKVTMDYGKALKEILAEVEEVKQTAKDEKDYTTYNQLVGRIMQGIELIAKLTGDIKPKGSIDINIIYNEINADVEKRMKHIKNEIFKNTVDIDIEVADEDKKLEKEIRGETK